MTDVRATSCTLHLTNRDGPQSLRQLLSDQCPFTPPTQPVSSAHFFVSAAHDGVAFLASSPRDPSFQLAIGAGEDKRFPVAEQAEVSLDSFVLVTPGEATVYTYVEYFPVSTTMDRRQAPGAGSREMHHGAEPFSMAFHITAEQKAKSLAALITEQGHSPPSQPISQLQFSVDSTNGRLILFRTPGSEDPAETRAVGGAEGFQFGIEAGQERTFRTPKLDTGLRLSEVLVETDSVANFVTYVEFHPPEAR